MTRRVLAVCLLLLTTGCAVHLRNNHDRTDERDRREDRRMEERRDRDDRKERDERRDVRDEDTPGERDIYR
jgi:hypothetical protein